MKFLLTLFTCTTLLAVVGNASEEKKPSETLAQTGAVDFISNVEYQLPDKAKDWKVSKIENDEAKVVMYMSIATAGEMPIETFVVSSSSTVIDPSTLEEQTKAMLEQSNLNLNLSVRMVNFEQTDEEFTYEMSLLKDGKEFSHSFVRGFPAKNGMVTLGYTTHNTLDVANARSIWMPVLKSAKVKNS
jgi:hypothetical protein